MPGPQKQVKKISIIDVNSFFHEQVKSAQRANGLVFTIQRRFSIEFSHAKNKYKLKLEKMHVFSDF